MTDQVNTRALALEFLLEVEKGALSHVALRGMLERYQYLDKQERAFLTRLCEGTLERRLELDAIINHFSKVPVKKQKPVIRNLLRMSVYQLKYMDQVPDSAVCNEAVRLAQKKGFGTLKGFVNGVLRSIARGIEEISFDDLSICYSTPQWIVDQWVEEYGKDKAVRMLADQYAEKPVTIRINEAKTTKQQLKARLESEGVTVQEVDGMDCALAISGFDYLRALSSFREGLFHVQDVSSMLVAEIANPQKGNYIIDMCAAPGGKSLHVGDKMGDYGTVDARDISQYKVDMIEENIHRTDSINVQAHVMDATVFDVDSELKADIVIADVPCSGYGVIGKKPEIKYRVTPQKQEEIVILQRTILDRAAEYVKPGGVLVFSTCTIAKEENEENMMWFMNHHPFKLESIDPYLPEELHSETTALGYLQLLPGVHKTDGFFIAKFRRK